jgi:hypothetical protein
MGSSGYEPFLTVAISFARESLVRLRISRQKQDGKGSRDQTTMMRINPLAEASEREVKSHTHAQAFAR